MMLINKITPNTNSKKTSSKRFLRRRCRYSPIGSNKFKKILSDLTTLKIGPEAVHKYNSEISKLETSFEQKIAYAVYNENIGNIKEMLKTLNSFKLTGQKESVRLLFLGIALEKNDKIDEAIQKYQYLLAKETNPILIKSAQFNLNVCFEKNEDYEYLDFTRFFNDKTVLMGKQRIKDKALTMQLILCLKENNPFLFDDILQESLKYEFTINPIGYLKTMLLYLESNKETLTESELNNIIEISSEKSINSRIAMLVKIHNQLNDIDMKSKVQDIISSINRKYKDDYTITKHIEELN